MRAIRSTFIGLSVALAAACGTATTAANHVSTVHASVASSSPNAGSQRPTSGTETACSGVQGCHIVARVDVNGDRHVDSVGWRQLSKTIVQIRVRLQAGRLLVHRVDVQFWWGGGAWAGSAYVDGRPGRELLVGSMQGAHTPMYTMLTFRGGHLAVENSPSPLSKLWQVDAAWGDDMGWRRHVTATQRIEMTQQIAIRDSGRQSFSGHDTTYVWTTSGWRQLSTAPTRYATPRAASSIGGFHVQGLGSFPGIR